MKIIFSLLFIELCVSTIAQDISGRVSYEVAQVENGIRKEENIERNTARTETRGTCGDNLSWLFNDENSTLVISGTGDMSRYTTCLSCPWSSFMEQIETVEIEEGVSSIGSYAFCNCSSLKTVNITSSILTSIGGSAFQICKNLTSITIPSSVTSIREYAFYGCESLTSITLPSSLTSIEQTHTMDVLV